MRIILKDRVFLIASRSGKREILAAPSRANQSPNEAVLLLLRNVPTVFF
jgi:hypothetical protein